MLQLSLCLTFVHSLDAWHADAYYRLFVIYNDAYITIALYKSIVVQCCAGATCSYTNIYMYICVPLLCLCAWTIISFHIFLLSSQFAKAYHNLQNTSRRHLNVHEPLIYDAVWLTAEVLSMSLPVLKEYKLTLNSSQRSPALISILKSALENISFSGLTVQSYWDASMYIVMLPIYTASYICYTY